MFAPLTIRSRPQAPARARPASATPGSRAPTPLVCFLVAVWVVAATGCGGGDGGTPAAPTPPPAGIDNSQRTAAAATVATTHPDCQAVAPFYWEIGDRNRPRASASVDVIGEPGWRADSTMGIASASKWLYGAYVAELRSGTLTADDIRFLSFRSGYRNLKSCGPGQTVDGCLAFPPGNGSYSPEDDGYFFYNGGHMQKHASQNGLGAMDDAALASAVLSKLGPELPLSYTVPQPAGGVRTTPAGYAAFLRKLLDGRLKLGGLLGSNPVCTNPRTCPRAHASPSPSGESWHYSIGHWVEDDPGVGDGAFSSAGSFGFYPWIDATRTWYGVLARQVNTPDDEKDGFASVACGRRIRRAWISGSAS